MTLTVRVARVEDAEAIAAIYEPIVRDTAISFESEPPDAVEMARRIEATLSEYPYFSAFEGGTLQGYAYASRLRPREAYDWCVELSVHVAETARGRGVGRALYRELLAALAEQGYCQAYAVISLPNAASVRLHESLEFAHVGTFPRQGFKLGRWHDVGWWAFSLRADASAPPDIVPFGELRSQYSFTKTEI
jgi:L-amino acid N-acyltransferase YncA